MTTSTPSASGAAPTFDLRRAHERPHTKIGWLDSRHSFSFGHHYDPANTRHGLLLVNNDDIVRGGSGFDTHPHRDMEIVTWVLSGQLEHKDSERNTILTVAGVTATMGETTTVNFQLQQFQVAFADDAVFYHHAAILHNVQTCCARLCRRPGMGDP